MSIDANTIKTIVAILGALAGVLGGAGAIHTQGERDEILAAALASQQKTWDAAIETCRARAFELRAQGRERIIPRAESLPAPADLWAELAVKPDEMPNAVAK